MIAAEGSLRVIRLPGEFGPILRCAGELTVETAEILQRELTFLEPLGHPVLTLNLSDCTFLDSHGVLTLLTAFKRVRAEGRRLVVVSQGGFAARLLAVVGFDHVVPVFPDEETTVLALRGGPPQGSPETWEEARLGGECQWLRVLEALENAPQEELLRLLTSMNALCQRSDELFRLSDAAPWNRPAGSLPDDGSADTPTMRCEFCPLFHQRGGRTENIGCQDILDPIIAAVQSGDRRQASTLVAEMIHTVAAMPLPEADSPADTDR